MPERTQKGLHTSSHIYLGIACVVMALGIVLAGLWPFDFQIENRVAWLEGTKGIHFYGRGILHSPGFFATENVSAMDTEEITVELWLEPDQDTNKNLSHIATFFDSGGKEYFTIAQWADHLVVIRTRGDNERKKVSWLKLGVRGTLLEGKPCLVTVTSDSIRTAVYHDGVRKRSVRKFTLLDENRNLSPQFILGSALTGKNPWLGSIFGLAIYIRALDKEEVYQSYRSWLKNGAPAASRKEDLAGLYLIDEVGGSLAKNSVSGYGDLMIPERYRIFRKSILEPPGKAAPANQRDILINILGFVPFGSILLAFFCRSTRLSVSALILITLLVGAGLSLSIELLQVYLPSRNSSLTDLVCNSLGTIIGLILYGIGSFVLKITSE